MNTLEPRDKGMVVETMPGISSKISGKNKNPYDSYTVKYYRADMGEAADLLELSDIETRALRAKPGDEGVVLIDKMTYSFMDRFFIILKYMEKQ